MAVGDNYTIKFKDKIVEEVIYEEDCGGQFFLIKFTDGSSIEVNRNETNDDELSVLTYDSNKHTPNEVKI